MIYGYSHSNGVIPIKFIINQAGSIEYITENFYKIKTFNDTLPDLEANTVEEALKNGKLSPILTDAGVLTIYNSYLQNRYSESELAQMLTNNHINYESDLYKKFYNSTKYCYGSYYINQSAEKNETIIPLLTEHGGNDVRNGVANYKYLKFLSEKYNFPIDLVYMRYGEHSLMDYETENGMQALRDLNTKIMKFAKLYFTSDEV